MHIQSSYINDRYLQIQKIKTVALKEKEAAVNQLMQSEQIPPVEADARICARALVEGKQSRSTKKSVFRLTVERLNEWF